MLLKVKHGSDEDPGDMMCISPEDVLQSTFGVQVSFPVTGIRNDARIIRVLLISVGGRSLSLHDMSQQGLSSCSMELSFERGLMNACYLIDSVCSQENHMEPITPTFCEPS